MPTWSLKKHYPNYVIFFTLRARCKRLISEKYLNYKNSMRSMLISDPRAFWRVVNAFKSEKSTIANFYHHDITSTDTAGAVELFSNYFNSVYNPPITCPTPPILTQLNPLNQLDLSTTHISSAEIFNTLSSLKTDKSPGSDDIPNLYLRKCKYALVSPLFILYNKSLSLGIFPDLWNSGKICPIYKKGNKHDVFNYWPISMLSSLACIHQLQINSH